jgi:dTDP-L-rhamnose 4-epimerase
MPSKQTVLVTGGAGFIGCEISGLLAEDYRLVAVDSLHPQVHPDRSRPAALHEAAELVVADVSEPGTWDELLPSVRPDVVIHLAAETGTGQSLTEASRHGIVNVVGTTQLLDGLTRHEVRDVRFVLSSSRAVYGEGSWRRTVDGSVSYPGQRPHSQLVASQWDFPGAESLPSAAAATRPDPSSVYAATKLAQEHILAVWCRANDAALTTLRLQNVYGPGQSLTNSYTGIVTLFSQMARAGRAIPLYEDGQVTRDFVYISDVAAAFERVVRHPPEPYLTFDVGSGVASTIETMATELARYYDAPSPEITGQFRDGDVRHASCDISATCSGLGWEPRVDLRTGLGLLQEWIGTVLPN